MLLDRMLSYDSQRCCDLTITEEYGTVLSRCCKAPTSNAPTKLRSLTIRRRIEEFIIRSKEEGMIEPLNMIVTYFSPIYDGYVYSLISVMSTR